MDNIQWKVGPSTFSAIPTVGARLLSWDLNLSKNQTRSVIHWPEDADFSNIASVRGGNPILFPFSARTFCAGKENSWKAPNKDILPMPKHGFARDGEFEIIQQTDTGFIAQLKPTESDYEAYPFKYLFTVEYRFEALALEVEFTLKNLDDKKIPWCAGHHFYFTLPWHPNLKRENYRILLPAKKMAYHNPDGSLATEKMVETEYGLEDAKVSDRIHYRFKENKVKFGLKNGEEDVTIQISENSRPLPGTSVVTWREFEDSPYYCVEPWMGPPNAPEHKVGLHWVDPGEEDKFAIRVTLEE